MEKSYLTSIKKLFEYYKTLGERTMEQLEEKDLFWQYNAESNSIAIIANHLSGNMKSRWTDFLTSDGEKEWRNRDEEFEAVIKTREQLMTAWNEGWACLFQGLDSINESNFNTQVYVRNQAHSIPDALNRQLAHYSSHIGQMVYLGKMIKSSDWQTLSIAKGKSKEFNEAKFSKGKHAGHFSDDLK